MRKYILGFVGAGNIAEAIISGAVSKGSVDKDKLYIFDIDKQKTSKLVENLGIMSADSVNSLCKNCDIIVFAVKPNILEKVLDEVKDIIDGKTIVSIAAGWSADKIKSVIGRDKKVLRLMPNTPILVGEGMNVFETPSNADKEVVSFIESVFSSIGKVEHVPAKLMDAVTAISGSGPAYVFMFIEALSDAGVLCGLPRDMSTALAAQTVMGAAKMVQDTEMHPGALKDAVCSPGGTTIEAVQSLEQDGLRSAVINAAKKCSDKSKKMAE